MDDHSESDLREVEAGKYHLNYIGLDGNIACLGIEQLFLQVKEPILFPVLAERCLGILFSTLFFCAACIQDEN